MGQVQVDDTFDILDSFKDVVHGSHFDIRVVDDILNSTMSSSFGVGGYHFHPFDKQSTLLILRVVT